MVSIRRVTWIDEASVWLWEVVDVDAESSSSACKAVLPELTLSGLLMTLTETLTASDLGSFFEDRPLADSCSPARMVSMADREGVLVGVSLVPSERRDDAELRFLTKRPFRSPSIVKKKGGQEGKGEVSQVYYSLARSVGRDIRQHVEFQTRLPLDP